jgi:hypothetical protein
MSNTKGKIFVTALVSLLKGLWKLTLLALYFTTRFIEVVSGFTRKLLEKTL